MHHHRSLAALAALAALACETRSADPGINSTPESDAAPCAGRGFQAPVARYDYLDGSCPDGMQLLDRSSYGTPVCGEPVEDPEQVCRVAVSCQAPGDPCAVVVTSEQLVVPPRTHVNIYCDATVTWPSCWARYRVVYERP